VYRFLRTRRWLGFAALTLVLAAVMTGLGRWQLSRYQARHAVNARIAAAARATPVPVGQVLAVDRPPAGDLAWTRVEAAGRYDPAHQILARDRTVDGTVGFEVLVPLVLDDGSAVLVDRGWLAPASTGANTPPAVPAAPDGRVTVTGRVHLPESRPDRPRTVDGRTEVRRISPAVLAPVLPYRLLGGYLVVDAQQPAADPAFGTIASDHQNDWLNAGYTVQWWAFALLTLGAFGWAARREARGDRPPDWRAGLAE